MKTSHAISLLFMVTIVLAGCSFSGPTADWKTYKDQRNDISFQYPSTWEAIDLTDSKAGVALRSPEYKTISSGKVDFSGEIYVSPIRNPENLSIEDLYATFNDTSNSWFKKFEHSNVSYNKLTGVKFPNIKEDGQLFERTDINIACDGKIVSFTYMYEEEKYQAELQQIAKSLACPSAPVSK